MIDLHSAEWVARDSYELRKDARRFEDWESAYALRAGLGVAVDYLDTIGIDVVEARVKHLADHTRALLAQIPGVTVRDLGTERCGIVSFDVSGQDPDLLVAGLKAQGFAVGTSSPSSTGWTLKTAVCRP